MAAPAPVIVIGIGLNVSLLADELPDPVATSLVASRVHGSPTATSWCGALLRELGDRRIGSWRAAVGADARLSADYAVAQPDDRLAGTRPACRAATKCVGDARSVDDQGRLCIATGDGLSPVSAGDIVHLRSIDDGGSE